MKSVKEKNNIARTCRFNESQYNKAYATSNKHEVSFDVIVRFAVCKLYGLPVDKFPNALVSEFTEKKKHKITLN